MADIPGLAISVIGVCCRIAWFIDKCVEAHSEWRCLHGEVEALRKVLQFIQTVFGFTENDHNEENDRGPESDIAEEPASIDDQHALYVQRSLQDCQQTLEQFESLLKSTKVEERWLWLSRPFQQFQLDRKADQMTLLRSQIRLYTQHLTMSLLMVTL